MRGSRGDAQQPDPVGPSPWRCAPVPLPKQPGRGTGARFARGSSGGENGGGAGPRRWRAYESAATGTRSPPARTAACGPASAAGHATGSTGPRHADLGCQVAHRVPVSRGSTTAGSPRRRTSCSCCCGFIRRCPFAAPLLSFDSSSEPHSRSPSPLTHIDPSWCARINAQRHTQAETASPARSEASPGSGSPYRLREVPKEHVCECCGTVMYDHNCKIVCPNCGYKRDCSDP